MLPLPPFSTLFTNFTTFLLMHFENEHGGEFFCPITKYGEGGSYLSLFNRLKLNSPLKYAE